MKKLIVFDLDGTLAHSKSSLDPRTATLLRDLLDIIKVAVISGGAWTQFEMQLLTDLPQDSHLANLSLLPTCGTKFFNTTEDGRNFIQRIFRRSKREDYCISG
jgi:hypothetical protein